MSMLTCLTAIMKRIDQEALMENMIVTARGYVISCYKEAAICRQLGLALAYVVQGNHPYMHRHDSLVVASTAVHITKFLHITDIRRDIHNTVTN